MTLLDALRDDMARMEDIAIEAGYRTKGFVVRGKTPSQVQWACAVAIQHLLEAEIKRREKMSQS